MRKTDIIAKEVLTEINWNPIRISVCGLKQRNIGMPDFQCINSRLVEAKRTTESSNNRGMIIIGETQIDRWKQLGEQNTGYKIFVMIFSSDHERCDMFSIKYEPSISNAIAEIMKKKDL